MKLPEKQDGGLFRYKGKRIHYRDEGEGVTLVLLHGYLESIEKRTTIFHLQKFKLKLKCLLEGNCLL